MIHSETARCEDNSISKGGSMSRTKTFLSRVASVLVFSGLAYSQTTFASITGTVTDASGSVVPTASVSATNVATNIKSSVKANEAGAYTIPQLIEGTYKVRTEASGFKVMVVDNVVLAARDVRRLDLK